MSAHSPNKAVERRVSEAKKPFDWMTDDQFHNLQLLAQNYEWFLDMFDRSVTMISSSMLQTRLGTSDVILSARGEKLISGYQYESRYT